MPNRINLELFSKDNNRFCAIFLKALKGKLKKNEIKFAERYAKKNNPLININNA